MHRLEVGFKAPRSKKSLLVIGPRDQIPEEVIAKAPVSPLQVGQNALPRQHQPEAGKTRRFAGRGIPGKNPRRARRNARSLKPRPPSIYHGFRPRRGYRRGAVRIALRPRVSRHPYSPRTIPSAFWQASMPCRTAGSGTTSLAVSGLEYRSRIPLRRYKVGRTSSTSPPASRRGRHQPGQQTLAVCRASHRCSPAHRSYRPRSAETT